MKFSWDKWSRGIDKTSVNYFHGCTQYVDILSTLNSGHGLFTKGNTLLPRDLWKLLLWHLTTVHGSSMVIMWMKLCVLFRCFILPGSETIQALAKRIVQVISSVV